MPLTSYSSHALFIFTVTKTRKPLQLFGNSFPFLCILPVYSARTKEAAERFYWADGRIRTRR
jgi:hypothetical protein